MWLGSGRRARNDVTHMPSVPAQPKLLRLLHLLILHSLFSLPSLPSLPSRVVLLTVGIACREQKLALLRPCSQHLCHAHTSACSGLFPTTAPCNATMSYHYPTQLHRESPSCMCPRLGFDRETNCTDCAERQGTHPTPARQSRLGLGRLVAAARAMTSLFDLGRTPAHQLPLPAFTSYNCFNQPPAADCFLFAQDLARPRGISVAPQFVSAAPVAPHTVTTPRHSTRHST
jgi:hypothetical protein